MTKITAHRGYSEKYPENTLLAFQKAAELGADRIELDVHFSKDKQLVVHHAYYLGSADNGEGLIFEKDWQYIKTLDAGSWFGNLFKREKIPLLVEVFDKIGSQVEYEIELKRFGEEFITAVLELIEKKNLLEHVEFTSSSVVTLLKVKEIEPKAKIGMFIPQIPSWMTLSLAQHMYLSELQLGKVDVAHCRLEILDKEFINKLHEINIKVHAADCNTEEELRKAFELGVDQLSTNKLELAMSVGSPFQQ